MRIWQAAENWAARFWTSQASHRSTALHRGDAYTPAREWITNNDDSVYFDGSCDSQNNGICHHAEPPAPPADLIASVNEN